MNTNGAMVVPAGALFSTSKFIGRPDIRKRINSQMLTVFFLPLVTAAVHTAFAFPIVQKLLAIFNLRNTALSLMVTGVAIVIFGIFYGVIYKITSNAYYSIVCGNKNE